ncbi:coiled-coil domain-containing protein [Streptomyces sp. NPDC053048]|uniref:coiled-coil domain-containing protein n=1 Tax=Streptomyces sp. NPDC053048 TaxID=3365694 RepID=UPI0037CCCC75
MSGRLPRITRLTHLACAAALAAGTALAAPSPATATATAAGAATAAPPDQPVSALLTRLRALYRQAEQATEAWSATGEKLKKQRDQADRLGRELADARLALAAGRADAGRLAREQYRGARGPLSPYLEFLLGTDPQQAMDRGHEIARAAGRRAGAVERLRADEGRAAALASRARRALGAQQTLAAAHKRHRDTARQQLGEVERLLASVTSAQLAELRRLERRLHRTG